MRVLAVVLGVVTTAALDLILLIGTGREPPPWFGLLVLMMDLSLIGSSVALGIVFLGRGHRLAALFLGNRPVMLVALALRMLEVPIPRAALFGADLYWLNLYLVGLMICVSEGEVFAGSAVARGARKDQPT